jgi:DNA-binding winged helix-turn-helix (wHTH) protein/Tol biopolymer transport system component
MSLKPQTFYTFGPFRLDPSERALLRDGSPVSLPPKAFDLLVVLVERPGRLVTKDELLSEVWPDTFVEEANLPYTVSLLRKALGDDGEPYQFIETVSKRGYRFKGAVARGGLEEPAAEPPPRRPLTWLFAAVLVASLLALSAWIVTRGRESDRPPTPRRLTLVPPNGVTVENVQISPDGLHVAFVGREADPTRLWVQSRRLWVQALDSMTATPLPGTEGAMSPFWAPDSRQVGFFADGSLKKIDVGGGPAQTLCAASLLGGSWSRDGVILYRGPGLNRPLSRVTASGGTPEVVTKIDPSRGELSHCCPNFLPDGRHFLYVVQSAEKKWSGLYVGSLDSTDVTRLLDAESGAIYRPPGYLLYSRDGAIVAQPFDASRLELTGEVTPIAHDEEYQARLGAPQFSPAADPIPGMGLWFSIGLFGAAIFSASETGDLAYSLFEPPQYQFGWVDRDGKPLSDVGAPAPFITFDLSPDGKRLAAAKSRGRQLNLWVHDLDRIASSQIEFLPSRQLDPRWAPDGRRVASSSWREDGPLRILEIGLDGNETVVLEEQAFVDDWSNNGQYLLYRGRGLLALPLFGDRKPILVRPLAAGVSNFDQARFSPDARLIAYNSTESGRHEVYVVRFPPTGQHQQISLDGGVQPIWRSDGKELYYLGLDGNLFAVEIDEATIGAGTPRPLFRAPVGPVRSEVEQYATLDGTRFLVLKPIERQPRPINVVINWPAAIKAQGRP